MVNYFVYTLNIYCMYLYTYWIYCKHLWINIYTHRQLHLEVAIPHSEVGSTTSTMGCNTCYHKLVDFSKTSTESM